MPLASLPDPWRTVWHLGPLSVRSYGLCVIAAIVAGIWITVVLYRDSGPGRVILDVAAWAVPFGLAGAAIHAILVGVRHDFSHHQAVWRALTTAAAAIGIPGAIGLGTLGAWIATRRAGRELGPVARAAAPGVAAGLAIGALGHWWTQDFYGRPAAWWLAERVGPEHRVPGYQNYATFQPAFLFQSAWDVIVAVVVIVAAKRFAMSGGRTFLLGAAVYAAGSLWVESVRIGPQPQVLAVPYAVWGDILVFGIATAVLLGTRPRKPRQARGRPSGTRDVIST